MAASCEAMQEPVCLVESDKEGRLALVPGALAILENIDQHVVVVAIVGLYRTGKSYLMNKLAGKTKGFALGATIQSKTKGIWMWCIPHPVKRDHTLVLLDTEGLGDVEKGDEKNDNWIFAMAVLLSSTLVYNSMGTIDNNALEKLHYVTELTEHIKVKASHTPQDNESEYMHYFPSFVWTVRDFTLQLELEGRPITANEYLDNALKLLKGDSPKVKKFNEPRCCLRNYFDPRWCFVFERPANSEKMRRMEELTDNDLDPAFVQQAKEFTDHIYSHSETKTLKRGIKVTGSLLGSLAKTYVDAIRSGQIPCLDNAVEALSEIENSKAVGRSHTHYLENMKSWVAFPTETAEELSIIHATCESGALALFLNHSFKDEAKTYQMKLMEMLQEEYRNFCARNEQESENICKSIIQCAFDRLEDRLSSGYYTIPGGYRKFCKDLKMHTDEYMSADGKGVMAEEILKTYLDEKTNVGLAILAADESLTEAEQRAEAERERFENSEREKRRIERCLCDQERKIADQQRSYDENVRQLNQKMDNEARNARAEYERILRAKDREMEQYRQQGFEQKVQQLQREIDSLRSSMHKRREESSGGNCTIS